MVERVIIDLDRDELEEMIRLCLKAAGYENIGYIEWCLGEHTILGAIVKVDEKILNAQETGV